MICLRITFSFTFVQKKPNTGHFIVAFNSITKIIDGKISGEHIVAALSVRPSVCTSHSCPANNFVIWSRISKVFYRNNHHVETTCRVQHLGPYLEGQGHSMTLQQNRVRPITLLFEVGFQKYFTKMITLLWRRVACNIWVATLKVKVTAWPSAKSCPAHNFVIWSQILILFYIINHNIDTTCCAQHLGRYLEGQGHSMTFQHNG